MHFVCKRCGQDISIRIVKYDFVTMMCRNCGIFIIYFNGNMIWKSKEDYLKWKRQKISSLVAGSEN